MFTVKRERTGRILNANFDHDTTVLSTFKTRAEAEAEVRSRRKAQGEYYGDNAVFNGPDEDFTVTISKPDYNVTEHFYVEEG